MCCKKSFVYAKDRERISSATKRRLVKQYIEGRSSYRGLAAQYSLDKNTILRAIIEVISSLADPFFIAELLKPKWSGILSFDGKYIRTFDWSAKHFNLTGKEKKAAHKSVFLVGMDTQTKDVPVHLLGDEETMIDLIMYFRDLKRIGYDLKVLVRDGNTDIERAARKVYGDSFKVQLCHKHFLDTLSSYLRDEENRCRNDSEALIERIREMIAKGRDLSLGVKPRTKTQLKILRHYRENYERLYLWTKVPMVPKTNNHIENYFRQLNLRLKTVNMFRSMQTADKYLNALILSRRFTKFTCCRGRNKHKNGKAPLELAGCDISNIDYLKLKKQQ